MSKNAELINRAKDKGGRNVLISNDNFTRHEALSEVCRLYRNGTIQQANELLNKKMPEKDMKYKCLECGEEEFVLGSDFRKDGRSCKICGGKMSPQGFVVTPRDETINKLRMIADDLEKGCGGFNFLIDCDLILAERNAKEDENPSGNS